MTTISELFQPLYGKPCWQAQQGYGSFLTFEFGEPHLEIREPRKPTRPVSENVRKLYARRLVTTRGDWHLWIYLCDWRILSNEQLLANQDANRRTIRRATTELDGQALVRVTVSESMATIFEFDLGGRLEIIPNPSEYGATSELWMLYEPSQEVFTLRADGYYCHKPGNLQHKDEHFQRIVYEHMA